MGVPVKMASLATLRESTLAKKSSFSSAVDACREAVSILITKPDERLQGEVGGQLYEKLKDIYQLLQDTSEDFDSNATLEIKNLLSDIYGFHEAYFLGML